MFKISSQLFIIGALLLSGLFITQNTFAAELTFKLIPNTEVSDNTKIIEVRVDPQSKELNVVEGAIKFSGAPSDDLFIQVENGQSILPIWPTPPQYNKEEKSVIFTGGVPNGFNKEGLLFRLSLSSNTPGELDVSYINGSAYLNDGKGTKESMSSQPLRINIEKENNVKEYESTTTGNEYKYATIVILLIALLLFIFRYGFRKNQKQ